jgi:hypothetical protein
MPYQGRSAIATDNGRPRRHLGRRSARQCRPRKLETPAPPAASPGSSTSCSITTWMKLTPSSSRKTFCVNTETAIAPPGPNLHRCR